MGVTETDFHSSVAAWFAGAFGAPTPVQARAWPAIRSGRHTLLAAPTGSGKTLAAFLAAIDDLVREGTTFGLPDETRVLYVSPLKALSNDIRANLEVPLAGIREHLPVLGDVVIRTAVRTGDTPATERARMRREPPHILVTTPESLFILLTSGSGRRLLATVRTVIVDELHALAGTKRGAHLMLSLERLAALCPEDPVRIGISATQKPMTRMAEFLLGDRSGCEIVDAGFVRDRDLALELPGSPLRPIMSNETWGEVYDRIAELAGQHRTTLVFVNTRRLAERAARHLAERLGEEHVTAHHGSLAKEHRLDAEQRLKAGQLKLLVATSSLELGIDIGDVDLVCQLGSPRGIAPLLQRVGRSGHGVGRVPKGRLFPLSRDDLVECAALLDAVRRQELDTIEAAGPALDVLAQQVVAEVAAGEAGTEALHALFRRAWPYRDLPRPDFDAVLRMLADGYATRRGRRGAHLHWDLTQGRLRPRPGAALTAVTNGGTIPDQFDYDVVLQPEGLAIGTLNEDFAFESVAGDVFQLGNTSYRVLRVESGKVFVEDAHGQPPNIPFWFGEAPGRSDELSVAVSRLREQVADDLADGEAVAVARLQREPGLAAPAAEQLVEYLAAARAALGVLPTHGTLVLERFFDAVGDMHLVIHSPWGSRVNRAFGLALRKRFCRKFNFELQAAALEDSLVLSLGPTHSFPLAEVVDYLRADTVRHVLTQALLTAPMFPARWRWVATTALAVKRFRNGRKVPPEFQRSDADDLLAVVFPDQVACAENLAGEREVPDHPLVRQALTDCLQDLMDVAGLEQLLRRIAGGEVEVVCRDLAAPSPLAEEVINARPWAFLDDTPAEERRTRAIRSPRGLDVEEAAALGGLDPVAIAEVTGDAWPLARSADELHDALSLAGFVTAAEVAAAGEAGWQCWFAELQVAGRATGVTVEPGNPVRTLWVSGERLAQVRCVVPAAACLPDIAAVDAGVRSAAATRDEALRELVRSRLETLGPVTAAALGAPLALDPAEVTVALIALEVEGQAVRGRFTPQATGDEWCDRRLLQRIHQGTLKTLRRAVEPASAAAWQRFAFAWHGLGAARSGGMEALRAALRRLAGYAAPIGAWEQSLLPDRVDGYQPGDLDQLLAAGEFTWLRPAGAASPDADGRDAGLAAPARTTAIAFVDRARLDEWQGWLAAPAAHAAPLTSAATAALAVLQSGGALFFTELRRRSGLPDDALRQALRELVSAGLVTNDGFAGLRALLAPAAGERAGRGGRYRDEPPPLPGRWSLLAATASDAATATRVTELVACALLDRYGVVFRTALAREARSLPPWRDLVRVWRRLEARGEIRGGRFVAGFGGEQFALPEAVEALRAARNAGGGEVVISAADPLNLTATISPGARVPAIAGNRVLYRDGVPVAAQLGPRFEWLAPADRDDEWTARTALLRGDPRLARGDGDGLPA
ncbi:MAG: DEAD/DEAH box helicase [Chromatiales bacterium]|nr:DEAD/DEAH box helicase [Chromatiales bacterium]